MVRFERVRSESGELVYLFEKILEKIGRGSNLVTRRKNLIKGKILDMGSNILNVYLKNLW